MNFKEEMLELISSGKLLLHDYEKSNCSKSGFMEKRGGLRKSWKKRWFILLKDTPIILYFVNEESDTPKGIIIFESVKEVDTKEFKKANVISIESKISFTGSNKHENRKYYFMSKNEDEKNEWIQTFNKIKNDKIRDLKTINKSKDGFTPFGIIEKTETIDNPLDEKLVLPEKYKNTKKNICKTIRQIYNKEDEEEITEEFYNLTDLEKIKEIIFGRTTGHIVLRIYITHNVLNTKMKKVLGLLLLY